MANHIVTPSTEDWSDQNRWSVRSEGGRVLSRHASLDEAVAAARAAILATGGGQLVVRRNDGTIASDESVHSEN